MQRLVEQYYNSIRGLREGTLWICILPVHTLWTSHLKSKQMIRNIRRGEKCFQLRVEKRPLRKEYANIYCKHFCCEQAGGNITHADKFSEAKIPSLIWDTVFFVTSGFFFLDFRFSNSLHPFVCLCILDQFLTVDHKRKIFWKLIFW